MSTTKGLQVLKKLVLEDQQLQLEEEMQARGIESARKSLSAIRQGDLSHGQPIERTKREWLASAVEPLIGAVSECLRPQRGKPPAVRKRFGDILSGSRAKIESEEDGLRVGSSAAAKPNGHQPAAELIAFVTLRILLNEADGETTEVSLASRICHALDVEMALAKLSNKDRNKNGSGTDHALARVKKAAARTNKWEGADLQRRFRRIQKALGLVDAKKQKKGAAIENEEVAAGLQLIQLALQYTNLFERRSPGYNKPNTLCLKAEAAEQLFEDRERLARLAPPAFEPTIAPPLPRRDSMGGGYHQVRVPLIACQRHKVLDVPEQQAINAETHPIVFQAINHLQATRWTLNLPVLETMLRMRQREGAQVDESAEGDAPSAECEVDAGARWLDRKVLREVEREDRSSNFDRVLCAAERLQRRDSKDFYYVWFLDWRGRAYPVGSFLNPQANDAALGLLEFADEKPVGEEGEWWLALHGANVLKAPGQTLDAKVAWINDPTTTRQIIETAQNPERMIEFWAMDVRVGQRRWRTKKAWKALAFCFEWARLHEQGSRFRTRLPVAMDGTCNAIQHLAAMLRDPQLARMVNLESAKQPADLYALVAQKVRGRILSAGESETLNFVREIGCDIGDVITRDLCKKPVMTKPYGITEIGIRGQIAQGLWRGSDARVRSWLSQLGDDEPARQRRKAIYGEIAGECRAAMSEALAPAEQLKEWMAHVATAAIESGRPVSWQVPSGFPVVQAYRRSRERRIYSELARLAPDFRSIEVVVQEPTDELSLRKAKSGIVANFVHSHDAAHMMLTTVSAQHHGIGSLRMVHDSFATHASDAPVLAKVLREEFVKMYDRDAITDFLEFNSSCRTQSALAEQRPSLGTFELREVLSSRYFFS